MYKEWNTIKGMFAEDLLASQNVRISVDPFGMPLYGLGGKLFIALNSLLTVLLD